MCWKKVADLFNWRKMWMAVRIDSILTFSVATYKKILNYSCPYQYDATINANWTQREQYIYTIVLSSRDNCASETVNI